MLENVSMPAEISNKFKIILLYLSAVCRNSMMIPGISFDCCDGRAHILFIASLTWFQILINSIPRSLKDNKLQDRTLGKVEEETAGWVLLFPLTCLCGCDKYWQLMFMFLVFNMFVNFVFFPAVNYAKLLFSKSINILFSGSPHSSKQIWELRQ